MSAKGLTDNIKNSKMSRRSFIKGMTALGAAGTISSLTGCSSFGEDPLNVAPPTISGHDDELKGAKIFYANCVHNCGTGVRCVSKIHVVDDKIVRVTTDESDVDYEGIYRDKTQYNDSHALTCAKGRSYKYRVHHPGRLEYVLKQTKQRGDLTGFVRMKPEQAMKEIAEKYRNVFKKYGPGAIYNTYGTSASYGGTFSSPAAARSALTMTENRLDPDGKTRTFRDTTRSAFSDYSYHQYNYAYSLTGHPDIGSPYDGLNNIGANIPAMMGGAITDLVSWGTNVLSTNNSVSYGYIRAVEAIRKRKGKAYFIGPEFTDTGVTCHTDWIRLRNYTDTALIMAMFYVMLDVTFNTQSKYRSAVNGNKLDLDYIDTCVHGFFCSPEYWLNRENGQIQKDDPGVEEKKKTIKIGKNTVKKWAYINEVAAGASLADYVLGSEGKKDYFNNAQYKTSENYYAKEYEKISKDAKRFGGEAKILIWPADMDKVIPDDGDQLANNYKKQYTTYTEANTKSSSKYQYKKDFNTPKTPEWASKITGVPVDKIVELAALYLNKDKRVLSEWCGGFQKQENGVINVFALSALLAVTKTFGQYGGGIYGPWASIICDGTTVDKKGNAIGISGDIGDMKNYLSTDKISAGNPGINIKKDVFLPNAKVSCTQWKPGIITAFFNDKNNPYNKSKYILDWNKDKNGKYTPYPYNDGSVKAGLIWDRDQNGSIKEDSNGFYKPYGDSATYAGTRMIISAAGAIPMNQTSNTNDTANLYSNIPVCNHNDADSYCLVTFDVYMSPTARYADYVIPSTIALEAPDKSSVGDEPLYRPAVVKPKGDVRNGFDWAYLAYEAHAKIGDLNENIQGCQFTVTNFSGSANRYAKHEAGKDYSKQHIDKHRTIEDIAKEVVDDAIKNVPRFKGMTEQQVYESQFLPRKNMESLLISEIIKPDYSGEMRKALDNYLKKDYRTKPFVYAEKIDNYPIFFSPSTNDNYTSSDITVLKKTMDNRPEFPGKMVVFNQVAVFDYIHRFEKYHGHLQKDNPDQVGQINKDYEGDAIVYPIPIYINFEDCFKESYGFMSKDNDNNLDSNLKNYIDEFFNKKGSDKPLTLSTTHDRFRVHSTHNENPLLRELNHRTADGGHASGNDWKKYAIFKDSEVVEGQELPKQHMINRAVEEGDKKKASWHEIWIGVEDAEARGIKDGTLCIVENPIGSVRVVARVSSRIMKGHLNLHQGGWYDPSLTYKDSLGRSVDEGGCANTLMASRPSRYDGGNAQQFAYCTIRPDTQYRFKSEK